MGYSLGYKACAQTFRGCNATAAARAPVLAHLGGFGVVTCSGVAAVPMDGGGRKYAGRGAAPPADRLRQDGATQPRVVFSRTARAGARATARSALREPRDRAAGNTARLVALARTPRAHRACRGRRASAGRRGARPRRDSAHRPFHPHGNGGPPARPRWARGGSLSADPP